jgi:hypothetical protein
MCQWWTAPGSLSLCVGVGVCVRWAMMSTGGLVTDVSIVNEDDVLFCSSGEAFHPVKHKRKGGGSSTPPPLFSVGSPQCCCTLHVLRPARRTIVACSCVCICAP